MEIQNRSNVNLESIATEPLLNIISYLKIHEFLSLSLASKEIFKEFFNKKQSPVWRILNKNYYYSHENIEPLQPINLIPSSEQDQQQYQLFKYCQQKVKFIKKMLINLWQEKLGIEMSMHSDANINLKEIATKFYGKIEKDREQNIVCKIPLDLFVFYSTFDFQYIQDLNENDELLGAFSFYNLYVGKFFNIGSKQINGKCFHTIASISQHIDIYVNINKVIENARSDAFFMMQSLNEQVKIIHVVDSSVQSFWERLGRCEVRKQDGYMYLDLFDSVNQPDSDETTNGIRVRSSVKFVPGQNQSLHSFFYSYQIRISDNCIPDGKKYQLLSRKWIIKQNGEEEIVEGDGVIGYQPTIQKGEDDFVYESCCPLKTMVGSMEGHFVYIDLQTKEKFDVKVGRYELKPREGEMYLIWHMDQNQITKIYPPVM